MNSIDVRNWSKLYEDLQLWVISAAKSDAEAEEKLDELKVFDRAFKENREVIEK